jgi:hypothetical protein
VEAIDGIALIPRNLVTLGKHVILFMAFLGKMSMSLSLHPYKRMRVRQSYERKATYIHV